MDMVKLHNISEIIDYSENSIVSKTIIDKPKGTITLFAIDKGQGMSEHTAPFDAVVQCIDGEGEIVIEKDKFILKSGDIIIMPANIPHALKAEMRFKMLLTMIRE